METKKTYLERISCNWSEDSIRCYNTPSSDARNLLLYVQEVGYFKTTSPYFTERANLRSFLIIYTISGKGKLCYDGKEFTLEEKQAFYIDCIKEHYYECLDAQGWEILWVHFYGTYARGYYDMFVRDGFHIITFEASSSAENTLRRILALTLHKNIYSEITCSNLLTNLLTDFLINASSKSLTLTVIPDYIRKVTKYLDTHFQEPLCLDQICHQFGTSKYHLCREFKKHMGCSVMNYIIDSRLNLAKELLRHSTLPINSIAEICGMNQVSYFIVLFKRREGITPNAYRKEWS